MPTPPTSTPWVPMYPMGPAAAAVLTYRGDWVPGSYVDGDVVVNNGVAYLCVGGPTTDVPDTAVWGLASAAANIGIALPASPIDGQEFVLVDSLTVPTYQWRFKYLASISDAYKWLFIGGAPIYNEVVNQDAQTSAAYAALTTPGPVVTLPRAGIYDVSVGYYGYSYGSNCENFMSYDIGGTGATDADGAKFVHNDGSLAARASVMRLRRKTFATAVALTAKYHGNGVTQAYFADRWMSLTPLRVA